MDEVRGVLRFLGLLFSSFFAPWWAAVTGFASIASFLSLPENGVTVSRFWLSTVILAALTLVFLVGSLIYRAWQFFQARFSSPRFLGIQRSDEYGDREVFLLDGQCPLAPGKLVELYRYDNNVQCLVAVLEVMDKNVRNQYQTHAVWTSPGHLRDLRTNRVAVADLSVHVQVSRRAFDEAIASALNG